MNKYSQPLNVEVRDTYVPLPVDHLTRSLAGLQGRFDAFQGAKDTALQGFVEQQADSAGVYKGTLDTAIGEAERRIEETAQNEGWVTGPTGVQKIARETHQSISPYLSDIANLNASLAHLPTLNLTPAEKERRRQYLIRSASEARDGGSRFGARQFVETPDYMTEMARFAGSIASPIREDLGLMLNGDGYVEQSSLEALPADKLRRLMDLYIEQNPTMRRWIEESVEVAEDGLSRDEFLESVNLRGEGNIQQAIADAMSYRYLNKNYSNPRSGGDGDEDGDEDENPNAPSYDFNVDTSDSSHFQDVRSLYSRRDELVGRDGKGGVWGNLKSAVRAHNPNWVIKQGPRTGNWAVIDESTGRAVRNSAIASRFVTQAMDLWDSYKGVDEEIDYLEEQFNNGQDFDFSTPEVSTNINIRRAGLGLYGMALMGDRDMGTEAQRSFVSQANARLAERHPANKTDVVPVYSFPKSADRETAIHNAQNGIRNINFLDAQSAIPIDNEDGRLDAIQNGDIQTMGVMRRPSGGDRKGRIEYKYTIKGADGKVYDVAAVANQASAAHALNNIAGAREQTFTDLAGQIDNRLGSRRASGYADFYTQDNSGREVKWRIRIRRAPNGTYDYLFTPPGGEEQKLDIEGSDNHTEATNQLVNYFLDFAAQTWK
jgi:hypothetical protein